MQAYMHRKTTLVKIMGAERVLSCTNTLVATTDATSHLGTDLGSCGSAATAPRGWSVLTVGDT